MDFRLELSDGLSNVNKCQGYFLYRIILHKRSCTKTCADRAFRKTLRVADYKQTIEGVRLVSKVNLHVNQTIHVRRAEVNDSLGKITSLEI